MIMHYRYQDHDNHVHQRTQPRSHIIRYWWIALFASLLLGFSIGGIANNYVRPTVPAICK